jgi:hypothetical protein
MPAKAEFDVDLAARLHADVCRELLALRDEVARLRGETSSATAATTEWKVVG